MPRFLLALALLTVTAGCVKEYFPTDKGSNTTPGPGPTPLPTVHTIEFRVLGTADHATIRYGSAQEGTTETITVLPWSASFTTTRTSLFVFIHADTFFSGKLTVQIFVDGALFREATNDLLLSGQAVDASGTVEF